MRKIPKEYYEVLATHIVVNKFFYSKDNWNKNVFFNNLRNLLKIFHCDINHGEFKKVFEEVENFYQSHPEVDGITYVKTLNEFIDTSIKVDVDSLPEILSLPVSSKPIFFEDCLHYEDIIYSTLSDIESKQVSEDSFIYENLSLLDIIKLNFISNPNLYSEFKFICLTSYIDNVNGKSVSSNLNTYTPSSDLVLSPEYKSIFSNNFEVAKFKQEMDFITPRSVVENFISNPSLLYLYLNLVARKTLSDINNSSDYIHQIKGTIHNTVSNIYKRLHIIQIFTDLRMDKILLKSLNRSYRTYVDSYTKNMYNSYSDISIQPFVQITKSETLDVIAPEIKKIVKMQPNVEIEPDNQIDSQIVADTTSDILVSQRDLIFSKITSSYEKVSKYLQDLESQSLNTLEDKQLVLKQKAELDDLKLKHVHLVSENHESQSDSYFESLKELTDKIYNLSIQLKGVDIDSTVISVDAIKHNLEFIKSIIDRVKIDYSKHLNDIELDDSVTQQLIELPNNLSPQLMNDIFTKDLSLYNMLDSLINDSNELREFVILNNTNLDITNQTSELENIIEILESEKLESVKENKSDPDLYVQSLTELMSLLDSVMQVRLTDVSTILQLVSKINSFKNMIVEDLNSVDSIVSENVLLKDYKYVSKSEHNELLGNILKHKMEIDSYTYFQNKKNVLNAISSKHNRVILYPEFKGYFKSLVYQYFINILGYVRPISGSLMNYAIDNHIVSNIYKNYDDAIKYVVDQLNGDIDKVSKDYSNYLSRSKNLDKNYLGYSKSYISKPILDLLN